MTKLEQMREGTKSKWIKKWQAKYEVHPTDLAEIYDDLRTEVRNETIKECEGCVPEERKGAEYPNDVAHQSGHNSCREQTLQAISKLKV